MCSILLIIAFQQHTNLYPANAVLNNTAERKGNDNFITQKFSVTCKDMRFHGNQTVPYNYVKWKGFHILFVILKCPSMTLSHFTIMLLIIFGPHTLNLHNRFIILVSCTEYYVRNFWEHVIFNNSQCGCSQSPSNSFSYVIVTIAIILH